MAWLGCKFMTNSRYWSRWGICRNGCDCETLRRQRSRSYTRPELPLGQLPEVGFGVEGQVVGTGVGKFCVVFLIYK